MSIDAIGNLVSVVVGWLLVVGCCLIVVAVAVGCWLLVVICLFAVGCFCFPFSVCCLLWLSIEYSYFLTGK